MHKAGQKIAGGVTVFYPPIELLSNIQTYLNDVEVLYVIDNSPGVSDALIKEVQRIPSVRYITKGINIGSAAALNLIAKKAIDEGYELLLTMDQDSAASPGMVGLMLDYAVRNPEVGVVSPFQSESHFPQTIPSVESERIVTAMTSGTLLCLEAFQKIGGYRDDWFIDYVDCEYCLRLQLNGYSIVRLNKAVLKHAVGTTTERRFLGKKVYPSNHRSERLFYRTRNRFYLRQLYGKQFPEYFKNDRKAFFKELIKILFYENKKTIKIVTIIRGFLAYRKNDFSQVLI